MAILKRLSKEEIKQKFNREGWFILCPVWAKEVPGRDLEVQEKNWIPEWWFTAQFYIHDAWSVIRFTLTGKWTEFAFLLKEMKHE